MSLLNRLTKSNPSATNITNKNVEASLHLSRATSTTGYVYYYCRFEPIIIRKK